MTKLIASFELTNSYFNQFSEHLSFVTFLEEIEKKKKKK